MPKKKTKKQLADPFDGDADTAWVSSDARLALYAAIVEGEIPLNGVNEDEDTLWDYFNKRPEVHNHGEFRLFQSRLESLRDIIKRDCGRAEEDKLAFDIYIKNHPKAETSAKGGYPEWEGHPAQKKLKEDMAAGKHLTMDPLQMYLEEEESPYREFPIDVFRSHIYQETRTKKYLHYLKQERKGAAWKNFRMNNNENNDK